jgi:hypothetical protein
MAPRELQLLDKSAWARQAICESVSQAFARGDRLSERVGAHASVWSVVEVFLGARSTIDVPRGIFELAWRSPVLRMSIALRLGEVRIGIIIPRYTGMNPLNLGDDDSYPSGGRGCDRIVRPLGARYVLFDYVFSGVRLGDDALTHRALSGELAGMEVLADAIYYEARHLREGVVHHVQASGLLRRAACESSGLGVMESSDLPMEIESEMSAVQIGALTGLPEESVIEIGEARSGLSRFILLIPEDRQADVFAALAQEPLALAA